MYVWTSLILEWVCTDCAMNVIMIKDFAPYVMVNYVPCLSASIRSAARLVCYVG